MEFDSCQELLIATSLGEEDEVRSASAGVSLPDQRAGVKGAEPLAGFFRGSTPGMKISFLGLVFVLCLA